MCGRCLDFALSAMGGRMDVHPGKVGEQPRMCPACAKPFFPGVTWRLRFEKPAEAA